MRKDYPVGSDGMQRGVFIVLEGPDGSGKTFHTWALAERLTAEGYDVLQTGEATTGPVGREIRRYLTPGQYIAPERLQILFTADRALHLSEIIEPALASGKIVICDRYIPSTLVYGEASGVDPLWLLELNKKFIQPDFVLFFLPPFSSPLLHLQERAERDRHELSSLIQERSYALYARYIAEMTIPHATFDTSTPKNVVMQQVFAAVQDLLREKFVLL